MLKKLILMLAILSVTLGCTNATYSRLPDGSITASGGSVLLVYGPDGKIVVSESFIPNDPSNFLSKILGASQSGQPLNIAALIQLLQGLSTAPVNK